jgi:hypothetical protein
VQNRFLKVGCVSGVLALIFIVRWFDQNRSDKKEPHSLNQGPSSVSSVSSASSKNAKADIIFSFGTPTPMASTNAGAHSWTIFTALVNKSKTEREQCDLGLKQLSAELNSQKEINWPDVRTTVAQMELEPPSAAAAIELAGQPDAKGWNQEALQSSFMSIGGCNLLERRDLLLEVISRLSSLPKDSDDRRLGIKSLLGRFQDEAHVKTPLMAQLLRVDLVQRMATSGLLSDEYSTKLQELKADVEAVRKAFRNDLNGLAEQGEHWKAIEIEMSASDQIRAKLNTILTESLE